MERLGDILVSPVDEEFTDAMFNWDGIEELKSTSEDKEQE